MKSFMQGEQEEILRMEVRVRILFFSIRFFCFRNGSALLRPLSYK